MVETGIIFPPVGDMRKLVIDTNRIMAGLLKGLCLQENYPA